MGKKERTHNLIINTSINLFISKRSGNVSMDEIAENAGIARRTLFNHFPTKEKLLLEITAPIFVFGIEYLKNINNREQIYFDDISELCLQLWEKYKNSIELLYSVDFEDFKELKKLHKSYLNLYIDAFNKITDIPENLKESKKEIASIIFRCFVPILTNTTKLKNHEGSFKSSLKGMIYGLSNP